MRRVTVVALLSLVLAVSAAPAAVPAEEPGRDLLELSDSLVVGTVTELVSASRLRLHGGTEVEAGAGAELVGFASLAELSVGDLISASGGWQGATLVADRVERLATAAAPLVFEGLVALLEPPDRLVLDDGTAAEVGAATVYRNLAGYDALAVGDRVRVEGRVGPSGRVEVASLERLALAARSPVAFAGTVAERPTGDEVRLAEGALVQVETTTELVGLASLDTLVAGDRLAVEGWTTATPGRYEATRLTLLGSAEATAELVSVVAEVFPPDRFTTSDGYTIVTGPLTLFVGFGGLAELIPGEVVTVVGTVGDDALEILAAEVAAGAGEDAGGEGEGGGDGLESDLVGAIEALLPPDAFDLKGGYTVEVDASTAWLGNLDGYAGLVPGAALAVGVRWLADGRLVAESVEGLGMAGERVTSLVGVVVEASGGGRFRLDGGEWLVVEALTRLDGDVDASDEIGVGMLLAAEAVRLGGTDYLALNLVVEATAGEMAPWASPTAGELDEALVVLAPGADPHEVAARYGATVIGTLPGILVSLFSWQAPLLDVDLLTLLDDPEIEDVGLNYPFEDPESIRRRVIVIDRSPTSTEYAGQKAAATTALEAAHGRSLGGGVVVAVLDTGVDPLHPLLRHRVAAGGRDLVDGDDAPWETSDGLDQDGDGEVDEAAGHGTFVAGLVLLAAPNATILPYRVLDDDGHGTTFRICEAVLAAIDHGADVVNMSFAYAIRPRVLDRLLDEASRRGVVLVAGAGNDGSSELPFPAADHRVLAVAAADDEGALAEFSNYGPEIAIAAPGVDLYSGGFGGLFGRWSGTSMAAPLVSGVVALLRAVNPYVTPEQARDALIQGATSIPGGGPGLLRADRTLELVPSAP